MKHTHRGNCQVCGHLQAVSDGDKLAKHGYVVKGFGFFRGVCYGSHELPAQVSVDLTHKAIADLSKYAEEQDGIAADYKAGTLKLTKWFFKGDAWGNGATWVQITPDTKPEVIKRETDRAMWRAEGEAIGARRHADMLAKCILPMLGKPLVKAEHKPAPVELTAGARVIVDGRPAKVIGKRQRGKYAVEFDTQPGKAFQFMRRRIQLTA